MNSISNFFVQFS